MSVTSVSVVVCTYTDRRWGDLLAAVRSVRDQRVAPSVEIIVAVDHNAPLLDRIRGELRDVVAVANEGTRGLSATRNAGVAAAGGDVIVFLDDDCVAAPRWLERLLAHYGAPDVAGAGGAAVAHWVSGRPRWFPEEFAWVVGCSYRGLPVEAAPVRNFIGANMSFRGDALAVAGGFRDGIGRVGRRPLGCEETELCLRLSARRPAASLVYEPGAVVRHRVPAERGSWRYFASRCWAEGRSKALVARLAGARRGLEAERHYSRHVLPAGVRSGVRAALRGDPAGALRAAAIAGGLAITALGYARGRIDAGSVPGSAAPFATPSSASAPGAGPAGPPRRPPSAPAAEGPSASGS
jgi:glycosyltransferase involved in cell wall biosynthesis